MKWFRNFFPMLAAAALLLSLPLYAEQNEGIQDAKNFDGVIANILAEGDSLAARYQPSDAVVVSDGFSRLYFDQFESSGLEFILSMHDNRLVMQIELSFGQLIDLTIRSSEPALVQQEWQALSAMMQQIPVHELNQESWGGNFTRSFIILLREGVEAILIIALLVAFLKRGGNADKLWLVWSGVAVALVLSVALAMLFTYVMDGAGKYREIMEGVVLLMSSALLLYTSIWLLSQQESQQWQQFLKNSIQSELNRSNQSVLFFMSFIAVFREGAETILFYQALRIDTQSYVDALWLGAAVAAVLLVAFYLGINRVMRVFRLDYFFKGTAVLLFAFAAAFTGKGIMELQAGGAVSVTTIEGMGMLPMLGVFPTMEGILAQLAVILLYAMTLVIYFKMQSQKNQPVMAES